MTTQESNAFENLPQELITEILSRLPVKSLLRFRCVSKSWLSHISSPEFQTTYLEVSTTRRRLIFGSASTALYTCSFSHLSDGHTSLDYAPLDFDSHDPYDTIQIVGSCNGLVCLVFLRTGNIIVWNPATRKNRRLPPWQSNFQERYGFGYDAFSDDYKIIHIVHEPNSKSYSRTYSFRDNSWKSSYWPHDMTTFGRSGMFMNGAIHWIVHYDDYGATVWAVVAQSLATGDFVWDVALPLPRNESRVLPAFLEVLWDRLCVCFECCFQIEVWVMEEYGVEESWSQVFCLDNHNMRMDPLLVTEKGLLSALVDWRLMSHVFFEDGEFVQLNYNYVTATTYAESFVNPNLVHLDLVEAFGYLMDNFSL